MIFDKEKLLSVYDQTKDAEPMQVAPARGEATPYERQPGSAVHPAVWRRRRCSARRRMWLMLPRGAAPGASARRGAGGRRAGAVRLAASRGWAIGPPTACSCILAARDRRLGRRRRSRSAIRSTARSGSALSLLGTAGLFLFQGAQFLAVATIVVYAGAILVTFLFVLMLAQPEGQASYDRVSWEALLSAADRRGDRGRAHR